MRMSIKQLLAVLLTVSFVSAQSVFSPSQPLGMPLDPASAASAIMGGTGSSVASNSAIMTRNVANLGSLDRVEFAGLFDATITNLSSNGQSNNFMRTLPKSFTFGVPLGSAGAIGFGYNKESDATLNILPSRSSQDPVRVSYDAAGGLSNWQLGYGIGIGKHLKLGASLGFDNYRKVSQRITDWYLDVDSLGHSNTMNGVISQWYANESDSSFTTFKGLRPGIGLMASWHGFSVGAQFTMPLDGRLKSMVSTRDSLSSLASGSGNYSHIGANSCTTNTYIRLAPSLRAGVSYSLSQKFLVAVDGSAEFWKSGVKKSDAMLLTQNQLHDAGNLGIGIQYVPAPDLLLPRYYEIVQYMAGLRYARLPDGTTSDFSGSIGLGLPLMKVGFLSIGVGAGQRTSSAFTSYKERYVNLIVGINGGISWIHSADDTY